MRVYIPLTLSGLARLHVAREIAPAPLTAYAVTPALREWYLSGSEEELEYAALSRAAVASLRLVATELGVARRRVVVAADVPDRVAFADPELALSPEALGEVRLTEAVPLGWLAAVHVDAEEAAEDVQAAAEAVGAADQGDEDAQFVVDGVADHELLWYGVQEIDRLV
ncbi:hypothetical protein FH609_026705 [Streptomyces sp. 3MP-14]|uniref:Uncharacterized protein n=1 Tax=Streptomyces mimosae TaxID=2586635 RepID=A0A5N5ZZV3_9ACTN|nr:MULTISPECIES: hypothetical protein [Streptomyces]KAB8161462.1 hypothetical protein FH607_025690 [Streptomyces mimosae]KAB8173214.1 hypothetical protein FH609_026705 [Streptomyces sp. 3MP-14]